jgi:two-component system chemotaxis response regulator CheY
MPAETPSPTSKPHPRLVLADDEPHVRVVLKAVLKGTGAEIVGEAANGAEALEQYRRLRPDLLLMDLNMPVMTGVEALQELRREFPDARVLILSSMTDRESVENCLDLGAVNYLRKDCSHEEIREVIFESLRRDSSEEATP